MDALEALRLQIAWGADEALEPEPVDRFAARAAAPAPAARRATAPPVSPSLLPLPPLASPKSTSPILHQAEALAAAATSIAGLRDALAGFDGCALRATASHLVFADGNQEAALMLIGEAPGAEEDRAGKPFVGVSGQLLDRMLGSVGLDRTQCLVTNLIPWRPPGNRNPTDQEILLCLPFLLRHIALVRPRRVVLLGALATRSLTGNSAGIRRLRGQWTEISVPGLPARLPALPMLHPAYLLRMPGAKAEAWADMICLRRALDQDLPTAAPGGGNDSLITHT